MRFGTWNDISVYRAGSVTAAAAAAARALGRYKFDLVDVQGVRFYKGGTVGAGEYNFATKK
jgi:hypothetical protein